MASKKGIELEFSIADKEATTALRSISSNVTIMNKELGLTNTVLKSNNASINDYKSKLGILSNEKTELAKRVEKANEMLDLAKQTYGENSTEAQKWQKKLLDAKIASQKVENQIEDTTKAIDDYGKETTDASKKTSIFGDVLKANLVSDAIVAGVKGIVSGIKAVSGAITGTISESMKSFAEYEQLTGGIETLFKDSADIVSENAQKAYKTAGISANQYMDQATSFSATLLQGLDGDTKKAAKYADIAIKDMSDNANKMGTDISMIQNAYQGFAKDNYTMLDNLKLGYGGTAGEMARLINDSGVMGKEFKATAENVKEIPFDKMIEAIHKTQEEMDITGTTSKEASETISGSLNSVKASWQNVLTAIASGNDEQVKESINGLLEGVKNLSTNIVTILPNIISGLGQLVQGIIEQLPTIIKTIVPTLLSSVRLLISTIIEVLPQLVPVVVEMMSFLVEIIVDNLPLILNAGITIFLNLIKGITESLPELIPAIVDALILIVETALDNIDMIQDTGIELIIALIDGIVEAMPKLMEKMPEIIARMVGALLVGAMKLVAVGREAVNNLITGILKSAGALLLGAMELVSKYLIDPIINGLKAAYDIGKNLVKGIWEGISGSFTWIIGKIKSWIGNTIDFIKRAFGIHSPSKVMEEQVGLNLGLGVAEGIEGSIKAVNSAMTDLSDAAVATVKPELNIGDVTNEGTTAGTITPIYLTIEEFINNREMDIQSLMNEIEFYRRKEAMAGGY